MYKTAWRPDGYKVKLQIIAHVLLSFIWIPMLCKIGILHRVKPFLTIDLSKTMFNAIVLPHFTHCDIIWASSDETNISRLQKLQNTCARVILNENRRSHVQLMLDSLSWMPIIDLNKYHTLVAVYKCTHGLVPNYLHNTFMQISRIHSYSTRQANLAHLYTRKPKLTKFKQSFTYRGVTLWNELPEHIRNTESLNYFKTYTILHGCDNQIW